MFVITGGGTGIGAALARHLAGLGEPVLVTGRRLEPLKALASESKWIDYFVADVSKDDGRRSLAAHLAGQSRIKALVHNAGIIEPIAPIESIQLAQWQQIMATNVEAPLFLSQLLLQQLRGGRVLNIGSGAAHFPVQGWTAYCVSKAALHMLTQSWQLECRDPLFASVMPGIIDTDMQAVIRQAESMAADKKQFFLDLYAQGRLVSPETVAAFLAWLLLAVEGAEYEAKEWDIYDSSHHEAWVQAPNHVPDWNQA